MARFDDFGFPTNTLIRFVSHLPFFYLAVACTTHFTRVLNKPELLRPPYSPNIGIGEGIAAVAICVGAIWNFFAFVPMHMFWEGSDFMTVLPVVMDGALAGAILAAVVLQSTYLPHPLGQCGNALDWHPKNAPSMFLVLILPDPADWPPTPIRETAKGMCNEFVTAWLFEIVIAGLLCIALLFDIKYIYDEWLGANGDDWNPWGSRRRVRRNFIWNFLAPHMRYRTRYADKKTEYQQSLPAHLLGRSEGGPSLSQKFSGYVRPLLGLSQSGVDAESGTYGQYHSSQSGLLASSTPNYGTTIQVRIGQPNTQECTHLGGGEARDCWSCGTGICDSCKVDIRHGKPCTEVHLNHCESLCSGCYYEGHCKDILCPSFWHPSNCICRHETRGAAGEETHEVCQGCRRRGVDMCVVMRERRERVEMEQIARAGLRCSNVNCGKSLSRSGPIWWRCSKCHLECRSPYHAHWWLTAEERAART